MRHTHFFRRLFLASMSSVLLAAIPVSAQQVAPILYNLPNQYGQFDLWAINPDGTGNHHVTLNSTITAEFPAWSRDARQVAITGLMTFSGSATTPGKTIGVLSAKGLTMYSGTTSLYQIFKAFSPAGDRLAYSSLGLNNAEIGVINLADRSIVKLGFTDNTAGLSGVGIDWSPVNNNMIVVPLTHWEYITGGGLIPGGTLTAPLPVSVTELFFVPPQANSVFSQAVQLTRPAVVPFVLTKDIFPAFSPKGAQVAFVRFVEDQSSLLGTYYSELHIINIDGSYDHSIASFPGELLTSVSWSADGSRLYFERSKNFGTNSLGVWSVATNGTGLTQFLAAPACCAAAGPFLR